MTGADDRSKVMLIGYGTLLWPPSVEHTLGPAPASGRWTAPVVVRGFRRLFNLRPEHYRTSALFGRPGVEQAGANVEPARGRWFSGIAFRVTPAELEKLDRREYAYDRVEVDAEDFASGANLGRGFVYSAPPDAPFVERDPARLLPLWRDVVWARAGAYEVGRRFGLAFDRSTWLADGRTLLAERYREHLDYGEPPSREVVRGSTR